MRSATGATSAMCRKCVREALPARGRTCLDAGAFLANWAGCGACSTQTAPVARAAKFERNGGSTQQADEDLAEDEEEETRFEHACGACGHIVAEHYHRFALIGGSRQAYLMECVLCGKGADETDVFAGVGDRPGPAAAAIQASARFAVSATAQAEELRQTIKAADLTKQMAERIAVVTPATTAQEDDDAEWA